MTAEIAFWDKSAILPLCSSQIFTTQSKKWLRKYPKLVVWWEISVEIRIGLARLKRYGNLTEKETIKVARLWEKLRKNLPHRLARRKGCRIGKRFARKPRLAGFGFVPTRGGACLVSGKTSQTFVRQG